MKKFTSLFVLMALGLLFTNCVGPKSLQKQINRTAYEPVLILDSEQVPEKSDKTIAFEVLNESPLTPESTVFKNDGHFLYLLVFFTYEYDMTITLGDNASNPTALSVLQNSFFGTFDRSGLLQRTPKEEGSETDYKAIVRVKELDIKCDYMNKGFGFGSFSTAEAKAQKSVGKILLNLELYDHEGALLLEKDYVENRIMDFASNTTNYSKVKKMAMKNLVENLTVTSQAVALEMTRDINASIQGHKELTASSEVINEIPVEKQ
ncbi:hypothetical protein SAMN04488034_101238 [Salinimicrobium catena]|uniref:Lipoprotein n=1 Tax=Salinimicrobium catena TaxID=390640 RepID=A0A1H5HSN6_9FLAO|nr:hypothetical protein [Salinimicrobium catena]SDK72456.1 hypothetical protein SAMN04488140_101238 [Salinimicrobium catena]SEE31066.1 hypothetical protein SAMN04488034_101238 [Salinimicrobium catena]